VRDGARPLFILANTTPAGGSRHRQIARHSVVGRPRSTRPKRSKERRRRGPTRCAAGSGPKAAKYPVTRPRPIRPGGGREIARRAC